MGKDIVYIIYSRLNYLVINISKNKTMYLNEQEFEEFINDDSLNMECKSIYFNKEVFKSIANLLGLNIIYNEESRDIRLEKRPKFLQNENNEKLVIIEKDLEYMVKTFVSKTNDEDYIKAPNYLYNYIIEALNINNYKQIEYNDDYFITKDKIFNNLDEVIKSVDFIYNYMFERYDYFNINLLKEKFLDYYNNKIDEKYFNKFLIFIFNLFKYYPIDFPKRNREIYITLYYLYPMLSIDLIGDKSNITEVFANIKYYYNETHNIKNSKEFVYYRLHKECKSSNSKIYEIYIIDESKKQYYFGYIENPIFNFDFSYINIKSLKTILNFEKTEEEVSYEDIQRFIDNKFNGFEFNPNLKEKCFK